MGTVAGQWWSVIDARRSVAQGVMLGLATSALDTGASGAVFVDWRFALILFLLWSLHGTVLAAVAQVVEGRLGPVAIAGLFVLVSIALAWLHFGRLRPLLEQIWSYQRPWTSAGPIYLAWVVLVHGGPFMAYCVMAQRAVRVRGLLARVEVERTRTAAWVAAARFEALRGRLDPALLPRAISAIRGAYAADRTRGESGLDDLVSFLRAAMPAVRGGRSTLQSELALLRSYAALLTRIDGEAPRCCVQIDAAERDLAFPPLLLIPVVDRLHALAGGATIDVRLRLDGAGLALTFMAPVPDDWLPDDLAQRLHHGLRMLSFARANWRTGATPALTIGLVPAPSPHEEKPDEENEAQPAAT